MERVSSTSRLLHTILRPVSCVHDDVPQGYECILVHPRDLLLPVHECYEANARESLTALKGGLKGLVEWVGWVIFV